MKAQSAIFTRRSVRDYDSSKRASNEQIEEVLRAAMYAPSAMNKQPWEFLVITNQCVLDKITKIHPYCESLKDAGTAIIVCGNRETQLKTPSGEYYIYDCSAATQNILLRAKELGLDTCWCGISPEADRAEAFSKLFKLPECIEPVALVLLGYGKREEPAGERFDRKKIHLEKW